MTWRFVVLLVGATACQPATTRPGFLPRPEALGAELRLSVPDATRRLAESLRADSIPVRTVRLRDGYIETPWFASRTGRPVRGQQPLGRGTVRVRAWADPARPGSTQLTVETLYRPVADPSLPERELERQVPADHPAAKKVQAALGRLVERYGTPPPPPAARREAGAEEEGEY
jgi:hypothetical protein